MTSGFLLAGWQNFCQSCTSGAHRASSGPGGHGVDRAEDALRRRSIGRGEVAFGRLSGRPDADRSVCSSQTTASLMTKRSPTSRSGPRTATAKSATEPLPVARAGSRTRSVAVRLGIALRDQGQSGSHFAGAAGGSADRACRRPRPVSHHYSSLRTGTPQPWPRSTRSPPRAFPEGKTVAIVALDQAQRRTLRTAERGELPTHGSRPPGTSPSPGHRTLAGTVVRGAPGRLVGNDSVDPEGIPLSSPPPKGPVRVLTRGSFAESTRIAEILRKETVGGALLLVGTLIALVWINSPAGASYAALRDYTVGPESLHLDLSLGTWAADGLLAIFFFVVGLELKREFVAGDLRDPARAALPDPRRARRGRGARSLLRAGQPQHRRRRAERLGHPDRYRHRVRARDPGHHQHPPAHRAAHLPAHPRRGRRPGRGHDHRGVLHRRPPPAPPGRGADPAGAVRAGRAAPDQVVVAAPPARRRSPGCWSTTPGSTPRSPGSCSASPSP